MSSSSPETLAFGATVAQPADASMHATAVAATLLAEGTAPRPFPQPSPVTRTTVLPRIEDEEGAISFHVESKNRYEPVKLLGAGGMGEVVLVDDHDIARKVAVKRLLPELSHPSILARFIDEIRTVGRLEHPNIVPIHDVGVDDLGRYFFVMKYVEGETLETVIEKLAAGDPAYHAKYSQEKRVEIFVGLLNALEYAHDRGIVHRDIKPANVMIGRYGEVVLMDWGIAKPVGSTRDAAASAEGEIGGSVEGRGRAFTTRVGSIIGTPAYMSPEQARGDNETIDARSDLYSACVLFHELISLRHYLADATTMEAMLEQVRRGDPTMPHLYSARHPDFGAAPAELVHLVREGLFADPARRYASAAAITERLQRIAEGRVPVQCPVTLTKRVARETGRFVDARPSAAIFALVGVVALVIFALVQLVRSVIPA